jgi:hypothetical protein
MEENQSVGVVRWGGRMDGNGDWISIVGIIDG